MTTPIARQVACPSCGKLSPWSSDNPWRPFCSERCKQIDLGAWATERYSIPGDTPPAADDDRQ
ncbi:DNA gyrase inhibitor YacG [Chitinimonas taiwanensis]|uniref:DNA gyrase inhibitor YacG n=1 Tax=Chitinimonas taiwanensis TaxID=240412 RepID=UPI00092FFC68|nr:DNA gyrase inhibitor YacG [Chitinimonas taiwanensis]